MDLAGSSYADSGELGCDDIPGWRPDWWTSSQQNEKPPSRIQIEQDGDGDGSESTHTNTMPETLRNDKAVKMGRRSDTTPHSTRLDGQIALLSRGGCGFLEKVLWAQRRGAVAVIVGDNVQGSPLVTMYAKGDTSNVTIPSLFTSHMSAHLLTSLVPGMYGLKATSEKVRALKALGELPADKNPHEGLWVTLSTTNLGANPFVNTLFILVVSPLVTVAVVYVMLLIRARIRRRRWRAPRSIVDQLPVRTYHNTSNRTSRDMTPVAQSPNVNTPLLANERQPIEQDHYEPSSYGSTSTTASEQEKPAQPIPQPRPRYNQKQPECSICLEEYEDGVSKVMSLPCGHDYHVDCVTPWLTQKKRFCPICKNDVVKSLGSDSDGSSHGLSTGQDSSSTDIQTQAGETGVESPSTMRPVSPVYSLRREDSEEFDLERGANERHQ